MLLVSFSINRREIMMEARKRINIHDLQPLFHFKPPLAYRPVQAGADGPIFRL